MHVLEGDLGGDLGRAAARAFLNDGFAVYNLARRACPLAQVMNLPARATAMKLLAEHEMGELFKVIGFATPGHPPALGFAAGDRSHRL